MKYYSLIVVGLISIFLQLLRKELGVYPLPDLLQGCTSSESEV